MPKSRAVYMNKQDGDLFFSQILHIYLNQLGKHIKQFKSYSC